MIYYYYFGEGTSRIITTKTENLKEAIYETVDNFCKNREYPAALYGRGTVGRFRVMINISIEEIKKNSP